MVTFKCESDDCANKDVVYNFIGNPETAMCGGCKEALIATDKRPDPEEVEFNGFTD
jgi:hypothetical protein